MTCLMTLFYINSFHLQQWNSNSDIAFSNSSLDSKLGFLNVGLRLNILLTFPNSQKYWKLGFANVTLIGLNNFFQSMKEMEYWDFCMLA